MLRSGIVYLLLFLLLLELSCSKSGTPPPAQPPITTPPSSFKSILSFSFLKADNPFLTTDFIGIIIQDTITVTFPNGTPLIILIPTISISGLSINPANKTPQTFTTLRTYSVTAEDGTSKNYFVDCKILQSNLKDIISFSFTQANNPQLPTDITANILNDSVIAAVPWGTNISNLRPSIIINGISVSPSTLIPQNFTNTILYVVTAENATTKTYKAVVNVQQNSATLYINSVNGFPGGGVGKIYALDPNTGTLKWSYTAASGSLVPSIDFSTGNLYLGIANKITAIDTVTRNIRWQYTTGGNLYSTPVVVNGTVYINCDDRYLYALDAATGNLKWRYLQDNFTSGGGNYSSPTVVNGVVYFGSQDNNLYAVDAVTGNLRWKTLNTYSPSSGFQSSPTVVNGIFYIGDITHNLLALDAATGNFLWVYSAVGGLFFSSPTVVNNTVYIGCSDGSIYAIDANTGVRKWSYPTGYSIYDSPTVSNGVVYAGQNNSNGSYLYAVDAATGTLRWMYRVDNQLFSSPTVFNDVVYACSYNTIHAVNVNNGTLRWKYIISAPHEEVLASPCIVDGQGNVFVSGISGRQN